MGEAENEETSFSFSSPSLQSEVSFDVISSEQRLAARAELELISHDLFRS